MPGDAPRRASPAALPAVRELLAGIVDYAGLFPPAGLDMRTAVENYASYRLGPDAWALGRFVVPADRLREFAAAATSFGDAAGDAAWRVSVLLGTDGAQDLERVQAVNRGPLSRAGEAPIIDTVEFRAAAPDGILSRLREIPPALAAYVEIPTDPDPRPLVDVLRHAGARAKIRTGGVTPEAFPAPRALLAFLRACTDADLPFKATAGLHHPVAGPHRLTYERDSPVAPMYGYLNLLVATALLRREAPEEHVAAALAETDPAAFRFGPDSVSWREYPLGSVEIAVLRARGMVAFGSCSFREPIDELAAAGGRGWSTAPSPADAS